MTASTQSPARARVIDLTQTSDFERLYAEFMPRVRGLVRKLVHDSDLVDDLVQETFLRAYHAGLHLEYESAHPQHTQWPWLAAVARNLALDVLRRRKVVVEHEIEDHDVPSEVGGDDPEIQLLATRRRESITEALNSVSARHRRILVMKVIEGRRYEEIAEAEGISVEALKSVLARARRTFRASYATIAQRRGLGVLVGGAWVRGLSARLRSWRDRLAAGFNEGMANLVANAPAAVNAALTAAILGTVAVAGSAFAASTNGGDTPVNPIARSSAPPASTTIDTRVSVEPPPVPSAPDLPVGSGEETPGQAPVEPPPAPASTPPSASVDTHDVVPVEDPPASATASAGSDQDGDSHQIETHDSVDIGDDGSNETSGVSNTFIDCPPPEERGVTKTVACPVVEAVEDVEAP